MENSSGNSDPTEKKENHEALAKATDAIKSTSNQIDIFGATVASSLSALGSFQAPMVVGVLVGYVVGVIITPALLIVPLTCVLLNLLARHFKRPS